MKKKCTASRPATYKCRFVFLFLLFAGLSTQVAAQVLKVTGTVKDNKGNGIAGVSVTIQGSTVGTTTDNAGEYSLNVPSDQSVLQFSMIGFAARTETVGSRRIINLTLSDKANDLDEVVVIGYGQTQKKRDVGGAISSVNAKQIMERQPINLFDALQGQAAGVLIMNDNGEPGAQGSIQIRGANTFTAEGNTPLYVVDGVITDNGAAIN